MTEDEFFSLLDESPRTPYSLLVPTRQGETRSVLLSAFTGRVEFRSRVCSPRLERCRNRLKILEHLVERHEREER